MMRKNITNFKKVIMALTKARSDHYDGENAIYRLAASVPIPKESCPDGLRRQIKKLLKGLELLEVRANRINIHDNFIEIEWYTKGYQMVMNRGQYVGLLLEFAEFLNKAQIEDLTIMETFSNDDPENTVRSVSNDLVNFFPEFNSTCFGAMDREPIEVMNLTLMIKFKEVCN